MIANPLRSNKVRFQLIKVVPHVGEVYFRVMGDGDDLLSKAATRLSIPLWGRLLIWALFSVGFLGFGLCQGFNRLNKIDSSIRVLASNDVLVDTRQSLGLIQRAYVRFAGGHPNSGQILPIKGARHGFIPICIGLTRGRSVVQAVSSIVRFRIVSPTLTTRDAIS
jgi:hypothetical protein